VKTRRFSKVRRVGLVAAVLLTVLASSAPAQSRRSSSRYGDKLFNIKVSEVTLEAIDFRDQTARMNVALDITNALLPISLKDFDYRLRLYGLDLIEGSHDGLMKIGGRNGSRIDLPIEVNLRSIPSIVWGAFTNRGRLKFDLDTAFTLPLFVFEKRFDKSISGEVPLKSVVDAASVLRARRLGF
jgi:Late embryogenesis abundant protein